jgi:diguanylate cyclase (GGDEF)-like protein
VPRGERKLERPNEHAVALHPAREHLNPAKPVPLSDALRSDQVNAEVLRWQSRYRLLLVGATALGAVSLRVLGALRPTAVGGPPGTGPARSVLALAATAAYAGAIALLAWRARRSGRAGFGAVAAVTAADALVGLAIFFLVVPPEYYARVLVLALFSLELTLTYFGRRAAAVSLAALGAAYLALVALARGAGAALAWPEELWTLALFAGGGALLILVQGNLNSRLTRLARLFERAEEGDFTLAYDVAADRRPDGVTLVGRAYNRMRTQLAAIALTDPLSGCLNRRGFEQQLAREAARAARAGSEVALLAVDVDYFKRVNDTFGHLAGDAVIREIGALLRETTRAGDVVARIGGEEFMVLAPATNAAGAFNLATRVLEAFRRRTFAGVEGRIPITASIGVVADRVRDEHMVEALRARADEALYAAKRGGRNRVSVWVEGGEKIPLLR